MTSSRSTGSSSSPGGRATSAPAALQIRPYRDEDEPEVLALLVSALGEGPAGHRSPEFFRWKHIENPFGRSHMLVCEADGRIVGLRAFLRWRLEADGRMVRGVRPVDTATHPAYQGRGIFSGLTRTALDELSEQADVVFNTPNEKSLPGYLKMGWRRVGRFPVSVRFRRPVRTMRRLRRSNPSGPRPAVVAPSASQVIGEARGLDDLLSAVERPTGRLFTPRTPEQVRWRYGRAPLLDYRGVAELEAGRVRGMALFRVRPRGGLWETTVADVLVRSGDLRTAASLLRRVVRSAPVDIVTCSFPVGSAEARAASRGGFVRVPRGIGMVVRSLGRELQPDPHDLGSWSLRLGDLEVF